MSPRTQSNAADNGKKPTTETVRKPARKTVAKPAQRKGGKKNLVIVESPAKAKTISKYLGDGFEVAASKGHVRDLPQKGFGIDIASGWVPTYQDLPDRKQLLADLKKQAAKADTVFLAPDPDREGEAIAWHLKEALGLSDDRVRRVTFNEITKSAVQAAFANPGHINQDRVRAQETRRFLDRVVGYQLSPLLRKKITKTASAGRVQSVAVRLIVEREREIQAFRPEEYWKITATLQAGAAGQAGLPRLNVVLAPAKDADPEKASAESDEAGPETVTNSAEQKLPADAFTAELAEWQGKKFAAASAEAARAVGQALQQASYAVAKVEQKDRSEKPPPPFTTSTLQQQAALRLRFTAKRTMMIAQRLYEGVELGADGPVALITYMRTDSVRISDDALKSVREHIQQRFGQPYLPAQANRYQSGKSAQEGHEAIRPTDLSYTPERVQAALTPEQHRLYQLIYNRFVASQMTPALFAVTNVEIAAGAGLLKAQGKILKFDGYRKVYTMGGKQEDALLPSLVENQPLSCLDLLASQHFTQPPPRFNEASLVKTLEKEGIGRPSTYAAIISKIQERGYVENRDRRFHATELGMVVTDALVEHFPKIMDLKFTSHMEDELDDIENAKIDWKAVLEEFYQPFSQSLQVAESKMSPATDLAADETCPTCGKPLKVRFSGKTKRKFLGCSGYPECKFIKRGDGEAERPVAEPTDFKCPDCTKPLVKKMGKYGQFLACTGYPECKMVMNLGPDGQPIAAVKKTEHKCDKCGMAMVIREGRRGPFLACTGYPKCKNAKDLDKNGNPLQPLDTGVACEKCGAAMAVRKGPRGPFLGCSAYPKCRSTKPLPEELKQKLKELLPPPAKKPAIEVAIADTCPECSGPMKARQGRRGFFLGCANYPKCKGTKEPSQELQEQLQAFAAG